MMNNITVGATVKRVQPGDYTDGRIGTVLELDSERNRARVLWTAATDFVDGTVYQMSEQKRTWVSFKALTVQEQA